jgi:hypothetical protein
VLDDARSDARWVTDVLNDFDQLWNAMTPENRRRLVAALIDTIVVDEGAGTMRIRFAEILPRSEPEEVCA